MVTAKHDNDFIRLAARIDINLKAYLRADGVYE